MTTPLSFQQVILRLHSFWAAQGCVIWEPYNVQVGAGTGNPATTLRVLGPEPWRVAYVEPSIRPDDGRFGENPNRMQRFYQYQVILKPDPGNPQELYLQSLEALGLNLREHDVRFVEDNWESPALGAWGLGWEVWLDGQEITQFTYFQQAGGLELDPVSVEITYGLERIVLALQGRDSAWGIEWTSGISYRDIMFTEEVEHCRYYFDIADVEGLKQVYDVYEGEVGRALAGDAIISAYDYVLKCSHLFNVLDTRGAIGVTERATYFRRMRDMTRQVAQAYLAKREALGFPLAHMAATWRAPASEAAGAAPAPLDQPADFALEIGVEEMPPGDVDAAAEQLTTSGPALFEALRLDHAGIEVYATPRRLILVARALADRQADRAFVAKGPPVERAYGADGAPTAAAAGFARSRGVAVDALRRAHMDGGEYVVADVHEAGAPSTEVLLNALPGFVADLRFGRPMRWNDSGALFTRPVRWLLALHGDRLIPFAALGLVAQAQTRGQRPHGSPLMPVMAAADLLPTLVSDGIVPARAARREQIQRQLAALANELGGRIPDDPDLLDEVTNLVESPLAFAGGFDEAYLDLPREVLVTVMRKHQRYFPVADGKGDLLPYFVAVRNGDDHGIGQVIAGNEAVLTARFSDAVFFYNEDRTLPLVDHLQKLATLTFQEALGSMLDKNRRVQAMVMPFAGALGQADDATAATAASILKADLGTQMVVELTSLQGVMGREYARLEGYDPAVATAVYEHWLPRRQGDALPESPAGILLALADRCDSLTGLFAAGLAPRATADPYGLRRSALGILNILVGRQIDVKLSDLLAIAAAFQPIRVEAAVQDQVQGFLRGRFEAWLAEEAAYPHDVVAAVLAEAADNPYRAVQAMAALTRWTRHDEWEVILDSFARCKRITRDFTNGGLVDPARLTEPAEQALYQAWQAAGATPARDIDGFLQAFQPMVPAITDFFDHVLVNVDDEALRTNRLRLLGAIGDMPRGLADLQHLSGF
jgi:glycyl-tRNA synthetase